MISFIYISNEIDMVCSRSLTWYILTLAFTKFIIPCTKLLVVISCAEKQTVRLHQHLRPSHRRHHGSDAYRSRPSVPHCFRSTPCSPRCGSRRPYTGAPIRRLPLPRDPCPCSNSQAATAATRSHGRQ